ncbi:hypothetical protein H9P43_010075 [Blastocladiella emersonii ATCC 22665]|nr:hypothetical protein H9P43_010075 [Blastocladiella emersonii ATCC 22665]
MFHLQLGNLFHGDISSNDLAPFKDQYESVLGGSKLQNAFFANRPVFYIYDDRDFGTDKATKAWSGPADASSDQWPGFAAERQLIANIISQLGVNNLLMLAGNTNMLAADDGTNTDYSTTTNGTGAGFPLMHVAPMSNFGAANTGQYSAGRYAFQLYPNFHFATIDVTDTATSTCALLRGWTPGFPALISLETCLNSTSPSIVRSNPNLATAPGSASQAAAIIPSLSAFPNFALLTIVYFGLIAVGILAAILWKIARLQGWRIISAHGGKRRRGHSSRSRSRSSSSGAGTQKSGIGRRSGNAVAAGGTGGGGGKRRRHSSQSSAGARLDLEVAVYTS